MGVYIKGMEMPTSCADCKLRMVAGCCGNLPHNTRMPNCPLVPVPSHGRLGDLDVLAKRVEYERFHHAHTDGLAARHHVAEYGHFLNEIADAPTVIAANDEEDGMDSFIRILKD